MQNTECKMQNDRPILHFVFCTFYFALAFSPNPRPLSPEGRGEASRSHQVIIAGRALLFFARAARKATGAARAVRARTVHVPARGSVVRFTCGAAHRAGVRPFLCAPTTFRSTKLPFGAGRAPRVSRNGTSGGPPDRRSGSGRGDGAEPFFCPQLARPVTSGPAGG